MAGRPKHQPVTLHTIDDLARHGYALNVSCEACRRHERVEAAELVAAGHGAKAVLGLRLRCSRCGGEATSQIASPKVQ